MRVRSSAGPPIVRIFRWTALVCLLWVAVLLLQRLWFVAHALHTRGTVLRYQAMPRISGRPPRFQVVYAYALPDGRVLQGTGHAPLNSAIEVGAVGSSLPVLFNPARPEQAVPDTWMELWFGPSILGGTGAFFAVFASILAYVLQRSETQQ